MAIGATKHLLTYLGFALLFGVLGALLGNALSDGFGRAMLASAAYGVVVGIAIGAAYSQRGSVYLINNSVRFWPRRPNPLEVVVSVIIILVGQLSLIVAVDHPHKGILNFFAPLALLFLIGQIGVYRSARFRKSVSLDDVDRVEVRTVKRGARVVLLLKDQAAAILPRFDNPEEALTLLNSALHR